MGFKRERSRDSDSATDDSSRRSSTPGLNRTRSAQRSESSVPTFQDQAHAEAHYGQEIESAKEFHQLQRLEKRYGDRLHGWLEEGMPKKAMGHPQEMADFRIQRSLEGTGTCREDVPGVVLDVLGSQGQSLDGTIQRALEDRMDADFSDVRVHTGAKAADAADAIDAKAFTCGSDIVFNSGEYDPESPEGQFLLVHERTHVKQQAGAAISMMPKSDAGLEIDPGPQLEREADEAAAEALSGEEPLIVSRLGTDVHIQRVDKTRREIISGEMSLGDIETGIDDADVIPNERVRDAYKYAEYLTTAGTLTVTQEILTTQCDVSQPEAIAITLAVGGSVYVGKDRLHRNDYYVIYEIGKLLGAESRVRAFLERIGADIPVAETGDEPEAGQSRRE